MNGAAEYSVLNDGYQIVQMGGAANQTTINNGVLQVYGAANDPTIKGGRLIVEKMGDRLCRYRKGRITGG